jgi:carbon storage regulator
MQLMLVLSRKPGQKICIGAGITITVVDVSGNRVRIGIDAPKEIAIVRSELRACWEADTTDAPHFLAGKA